jgi:urease accessory protein UreF
MLSDKQIIKYQTLYKNRYGKEISREEAYEQGAKLIRLVELVYKPMTAEEYEMVQKRRKETNI